MKCICTCFLMLILSSELLAQVLKTAEQEQLLEYYQAQRYDEASRLLKTAFGDDPSDPKEIQMLAYPSNMAGDLKLAEKQYIKLNKANPEDLGTLFSLAAIYAKRGNDDKAKMYYQQVLSIDSNNFRALKMIASSTNDPVEKRSKLVKANQVNPKQFKENISYVKDRIKNLSK